MANELLENKIMWVFRINFWICWFRFRGEIFTRGEDNFLAEHGKALGVSRH